MKIKKAFSLVELSIVILIIGTLIAGIAKAKDIFSFANKKMVQRLTKNSPVVSMSDLVLWYETTLDESFLASQRSDGSSISQWNDIKSETIHGSASNITTASGREPSFAKDAFGTGVHGVRFAWNGTNNDYLQLNSLSAIWPEATIFFVGKQFNRKVATAAVIPLTFSSGDFRFYNDNGENNGGGNDFALYHSAYLIDFIGSINNIIGKVAIFSITKDGTNVYGHLNGSLIGSAASNVSVGGTLTLALHHNALTDRGYEGDIGEVIVFSRALDEIERKEVEEYLGQKYNIQMGV